MENEIWKDVVGFEGRYQVSNLGRVKSIKRIKPTKENPTGIKEIIMIPYSGAARYLGVTLRKDGKGKTHTIHRLVAQAFLPNPLGLPCVNHKDENCLNNNADNLEWCTQEYNVNYGTAIDKKRQSLLKYSSSYGKSVIAYTKEGEFVGRYNSIAVAIDSLGIRPRFAKRARVSHIAYCCDGKSDIAYGYKWKYA